MARQTYEQALGLLVNNTDDHRCLNAETYQDWLQEEFNAASEASDPPPNAWTDACYANAERLLSSIALRPLREARLRDFAMQWRGPPPEDPEGTPVMETRGTQQDKGHG